MAEKYYNILLTIEIQDTTPEGKLEFVYVTFNPESYPIKWSCSCKEWHLNLMEEGNLSKVVCKHTTKLQGDKLNKKMLGNCIEIDRELSPLIPK